MGQHQGLTGCRGDRAWPSFSFSECANLWFDLDEDPLLSRGPGHSRIGLSIVPETYEEGLQTDNAEPYWRSLTPTDAVKVILAEIDRVFRMGEEANLDVIDGQILRAAARHSASGRCDLKALLKCIDGLQHLRDRYNSGQEELEMLRQGAIEMLRQSADKWRLATAEDFADEPSAADVKPANQFREDRENGRDPHGSAEAPDFPARPASGARGARAEKT